MKIPAMVIPDECLPLLREQRTSYGNGDITAQYVNELWQTYESIRSYLPGNGRILDIGCGMAGIDVFLSLHYNGRGQITLADKQEVSPEINAGFHSEAKDFSHYHDFAAASKLLESNGVTGFRCVDLNVEPLPNEEFDVVLSLLSWGFHYPISAYSPTVAPGGVVIADIRRGTGGEDELNLRYGNALVVHEAKKYLRIVALC
jgi:SAM-dependent methyltransferase